MTTKRPLEIPPDIRRALELLLEAYDYAEELKHDVWDFAVEIRYLCEAGAGVNGLRWLVCRNLVRHGVELPLLGETKRTIHPVSWLAFTDQTCFVLTSEGVTIARKLPRCDSTPLRWPDGDGTDAANMTCPRWDGQRRELWWGQKLVRHYRNPAPHQEAILAAFEEEGWPPAIDDPLSPISGVDHHLHLANVLKGLNRRQSTLVFMLDSSGQQILWTLRSRIAPNSTE